MPGNFERLGTAPEVRRAHQLAFSMHMLSDITAQYDAVVDRGDMLCGSCMIDSFYVNIRLLAEFLTRRTWGKDFGPVAFVAGWSAPVSEAAERLSAAWDVASAYVVHLSTRRVPDNLEDLSEFEVSGSSLRTMLRDAIEVYAEFVDMVAHAAAPWTDGARIPDPDTEPNAWGARIGSDVVTILRDALEHGRAVVRA